MPSSSICPSSGGLLALREFSEVPEDALASASKSKAAAKPQAKAKAAASTSAEGEATAADDTLFAEKLRIPLETVLEEWHAAATGLSEHACSVKNQKYTLLGLVYAALAAMGKQTDEHIQPESLVQCVSKLAVAVYAFPRHPDL